MPFLLASLTGPLVNFATHLIDSLGLAGVALLTLSSGVIGDPGNRADDAVRGLRRVPGQPHAAGIIVAGVIGDVAGASIAYAIGYFGRRELLESPRLQAACRARAAWIAPTAGLTATARR